MRRNLVVGNWKMHGSLASVNELLSGLKSSIGSIDSLTIAVCPPFIFAPVVEKSLAGTAIQWGSQNISENQQGAYTGEVSGAMLAEFGCRYAIVGHSERRSIYSESDLLVAQKYMAAQQAGLTPIVCVGESLEQREAGKALTTVERQLEILIDEAGIESFSRAVIAYEPVWAIGTGKTATPEQAQEVHSHIRQVIGRSSEQVAAKIQIIYGGSVNAGNSAQLFAKEDIDGALVGGASLKAVDFSAIVNAASGG